MDLNVNGLEELNKAIKEIVTQFPEEEQKQLMRLGYILEAEVKTRVPVDTGTLRASMTTQTVDQHNVEVGTNVEYAPYINDGHVTRDDSFVEGVHFMEDSIEASEAKQLQDLENLVNAMFEKLG